MQQLIFHTELFSNQPQLFWNSCYWPLLFTLTVLECSGILASQITITVTSQLFCSANTISSEVGFDNWRRTASMSLLHCTLQWLTLCAAPCSLDLLYYCSISCRQEFVTKKLGLLAQLGRVKKLRFLTDFFDTRWFWLCESPTHSHVMSV